jgi:hypothetical protein
MDSPSRLTPILPCNDLDVSERFYNRLGFARPASRRPTQGEPDTYRMLWNGKGGQLTSDQCNGGMAGAGQKPIWALSLF